MNFVMYSSCTPTPCQEYLSLKTAPCSEIRGPRSIARKRCFGAEYGKPSVWHEGLY